MSATAAVLVGQLSKPLASALLGKGFNWRLALKSGGMPSTHSASMVASATAIGLERGLSDSLFGLTVVVAGIIMYDAQVRLSYSAMRFNLDFLPIVTWNIEVELIT